MWRVSRSHVNTTARLFPPDRRCCDSPRSRTSWNHFWARSPKRCTFLPAAPSVHRQSIPPWLEELTVKPQARRRVRGGKRWEWPQSTGSICYSAGCAARMSRLGKEVRGLLFPLPARSDIEGMTEVLLRSSQLQLRPLAVFPEVHYGAFKGNQWGDKLLWTAATTPPNPLFYFLLCCCMHACRRGSLLLYVLII